MKNYKRSIIKVVDGEKTTYLKHFYGLQMTEDKKEAWNIAFGKTRDKYLKIVADKYPTATVTVETDSPPVVEEVTA